MKFATIDINTGKVTEETDFPKETYDEYINKFREYILPVLRSLYNSPSKSAHHSVDRNHVTGWVRRLDHVNGYKERQIRIRFSWNVDIEKTTWLLRIGLTRYEWMAGRISCPWIIYQGGIFYVSVSDLAWSFILMDDGLLEARRGLSNAS